MGLLQTLENIFTDVSNSTQISQDTRLLSNVIFTQHKLSYYHFKRIKQKQFLQT